MELVSEWAMLLLPENGLNLVPGGGSGFFGVNPSNMRTVRELLK